MKIQDCVDYDFLTNGRFARLLPVIAVLAILLAQYVVFLVVPDERVMGPVQRIFYFHVASAFSSYGMIAVLLVSSAFYLATSTEEWDILANAAAAVGLLFCSILLLTGMIWGHSAWNTWWRWEPRLVSSLLLWLILVSYRFLRAFAKDEPNLGRISAVLGIVAAVFVPVVIFSIQLLNQNEQLHPQVIARQGLTDPSYKYGLLLSSVAILLFSLWMLFVKLTSGVLTKELRTLTRDVNRLKHRQGI